MCSKSFVMSSWREKYIAALHVRDAKENNNTDFYRSYTKLADRTAAWRSDSLAQESLLKLQQETPESTNLPPAKQLPPGIIEKIREDLVDAQQNRAQLQGRLTSLTEDLDKLHLKSKSEGKRVGELLAERQNLAVKLRDRDEELRGKAKLLENVHDETVSLTLQLNMAEAQSQKLQAENKELVDRWMTRMAQEADAMNIASKFS